MPSDAAHSRADRLRDFYGLDQGEGHAPQEPTELVTENAKESPAAVPFSELVATRPLSELVRMATALSDSACVLTDIRELHGDRQSLVYNHHQELVAAAETVGQMRSGIDELNQSRDVLAASFAEIEKLCESLSAVPERSAADMEWSPVYPIVALPAILTEMAEKQQVEELETTWKKYQPVLEAWDASGVAGASHLLSSCRAAVQSSA